MKTRFAAILVMLAVPTLAACGSSPCDDIKACCEALASDAGIDSATAGCDAYDKADDDACQTAIDNTDTSGLDNIPDECKF